MHVNTLWGHTKYTQSPMRGLTLALCAQSPNCVTQLKYIS